jgi:hypothetical protein
MRKIGENSDIEHESRKFRLEGALGLKTANTPDQLTLPARTLAGLQEFLKYLPKDAKGMGMYKKLLTGVYFAAKRGVKIDPYALVLARGEFVDFSPDIFYGNPEVKDIPVKGLIASAGVTSHGQVLLTTDFERNYPGIPFFSIGRVGELERINNGDRLNFDFSGINTGSNISFDVKKKGVN